MEYLKGYYVGVEDGYKIIHAYIKGRQDVAKECQDVSTVLTYEPLLRHLEEAIEQRENMTKELEKAIKED